MSMTNNNLPIDIHNHIIDWDPEAGALVIVRGDYIINIGETGIEVLDIDSNFIDSIDL